MLHRKGAVTMVTFRGFSFRLICSQRRARWPWDPHVSLGGLCKWSQEPVCFADIVTDIYSFIGNLTSERGGLGRKNFGLA